MKDDDPVRLLPIRDMQVLSTMSSAEKFIDPFQPTAGAQFQRTRFQYFEEVVFVVAMLECTFDKFDHFVLRIA